jgi:IS5 family transposase
VEGLSQALGTMVGRVRQVVKQTRIRIFAGDTKLPGKIMSVFKPHTEIIRNAAQQKIPRTQVIVDVDAVWPM